MDKFQINQNAMVKTTYGLNKIKDMYNLIKREGPNSLRDVKLVGYFNRKDFMDTIVDIKQIEVDRIGFTFGRLSNVRHGQDNIIYDMKAVVGSDQLLIVDGNTNDPKFIKASDVVSGQDVSSYNGSLKVHEARNLGKGICYDVVTENNIQSIFEDCLLLVANNTEEENQHFLKFLLKK